MFWKSFGNTFVYCLVVVPGSVFLGLGLALLIEGATFGRAFYRAAYFLPVTSTLIAMAVVWEFLLHPSVGLINIVLEQVGISGGDWLKNPSKALFTLAGIGIWQSAGLNMVLFMAGPEGDPARSLRGGGDRRRVLGLGALPLRHLADAGAGDAVRHRGRRASAPSRSSTPSRC